MMTTAHGIPTNLSELRAPVFSENTEKAELIWHHRESSALLSLYLTSTP